MNRPVFTVFEDAVTTAIEERAEVTRSDAQAIVEAKPAILHACFDEGLTVDVAVSRILGEEPAPTPTPDRSAWHMALDAALIAQTGDEAAPMNVSAPDELWAALEAAGVRPELAAAVLLNDPRTEVIAWRDPATAPVGALVMAVCRGPHHYVTQAYRDEKARWRDLTGWPMAADEVKYFADRPKGPAAGEGVPC